MLRIIGFWVTINKASNIENAGFLHFLLTQLFFQLYFYSQYLTNGNSKAY